MNTIRYISIGVLFILLCGFVREAGAVSKDETAFLVTVSCTIKIWETVQKDCEKKVQVRKNGRWVYETKKEKCPETVEAVKKISLTDVIVAKNQAEAKTKMMLQFKGRDLKNVTITGIKPVR